MEAATQRELEGKRIAQVPEHQLVAQGGYTTTGGLDISLQIRVIDDQFEDDLNTRTLDGFTTVDLALSPSSWASSGSSSCAARTSSTRRSRSARPPPGW